MSQVSVNREGDIALVTIERPERRNALDSAAAKDLAEAISSAGRSARVVILTGAGGAFCAGGDLEELERWSSAPADEIATKLYGTFQSMIRNIRASDAVVIAAVDGAAVGAGMDLALACDLRIASERARFGQVWVRLGVIPGTGGAWLTQMIVGPGRAAELLLSGEIIGAERALAYGIVSRVVPADSLLDEARIVAESLLRNPREGLIANKRAMVGAQEAAVEAALQHAAEVQPERFRSDEFKAALKGARNR